MKDKQEPEEQIYTSEIRNRGDCGPMEEFGSVQEMLIALHHEDHIRTKYLTTKLSLDRGI